MRAGTPSLTAEATLLVRAAHTLLDAPPLVLDDSAAVQLLAQPQQQALRRLQRLPVALRARFSRSAPALSAMRAQVVVRSRYAEDCLTATKVDRYLVLGAGYDTYALRQKAPQLPVLEIDHPATQRRKRQRLARLGIANPPALTYLPVDFERESLRTVLPVGTERDFISWLGVTYYLRRQDIEQTLSDLAERCPPGSRLVLDAYEDTPRDLSATLLWGTRMAVAMQGEPMRSFFDGESFCALAQPLGWELVEHLNADAQNARYLKHRRDGLRVPRFAHLLQLELR